MTEQHQQAGETHTRDGVRAFVLDWVTDQELLAGQVEPSKSLDDIGFDSLAIVDLVGAVKRRLGIEVNAADFHPQATLDDTIDTICARGGVA